MSRRRPLRKLPAAFLWLAFAAAAGLGVLQWLVPWLARRGDFNAIFENVIRSSLAVPVRIERIETEPFSELRITKLHSVAAESSSRLRFEARAITFSYDPLELLEGRLREVRFDDPGLFLNLDAELSRLARVPDLTAAAATAERSPGRSTAAGGDLLPFTVGSLVLERGALTLRFLGNDLPLSNLRFEASELGKAVGQTFRLAVEVLGGSVRAWGGVDVLREPGQTTRYAFRDARIVIDDVEAAALLSWLTAVPELAAWLPAVSIAAGSKLQLEGSFEGTYPERVEVSLATHALDVSGSHASGYSLSTAMAGLHVCASVLGDLESVQFTISTHAEGILAAGAEPRAEVGSLEIAGELRRDGALTISPSAAQIEGLGRLRFAGSVDASDGDRSPELRFEASTDELDVAGVLARLPDAARRWLEGTAGVGAIAGQATVEVRCGGDATRPRCDLTLTVPQAVATLRGGRELTAALRSELTGLELDVADGSILLEKGSLRLEGIGAGALAGAWLPEVRAGEVTGTLDVALTTSDVTLPRDLRTLPLGLDVEWRDLAFTPPHWPLGWAGASGKLGAQVAPNWTARRAELAVRGEGTVAEVLAGRFYASLAAEPLTWSAAGKVVWSEDGASGDVTLDEADLSTPLTGPVAGRGTLRLQRHAGAAVDLELDAPRIPGARAFRAFVAEPFAASSALLGEAAFDGDAALSVSIAGPVAGPAIRGHLAVGPADFTSGTLALEGFEAALPFVWQRVDAAVAASPLEGFVRAHRIHAPGTTLRAVHVGLTLDGDRYHLEPLAVQLHGGRVTLGHACLRLLGPGAPEGSVHLRGEGLQAASLARAHGLPALDGTISFAWDPLLIDGSRPEFHGTLRWRAFGGELSFTDLTLENVTRPYAGLRLGEGSVRDLDLGVLGERFRFGVASGILRGTVHDVEIAGGELTRFRLDVETVRRQGVKQYLNRAAIESIRRVLAGPLGALEETLFSKFYFWDFGFTAKLENDTFRLRGKYRDGDTEYILRGRWFDLPRIDIINARPGKEYEWRQIVENLRRVYEGR